MGNHDKIQTTRAVFISEIKNVDRVNFFISNELKRISIVNCVDFNCPNQTLVNNINWNNNIYARRKIKCQVPCT